MGVDIGRKSNITVGKKDAVGKLHVVYLERFKASKEKTAGERIVEIARLFGARCIVIDAMPDFTTTHYVARKFANRLVLACEYTSGKPKGKLANFKVDAEMNLVSSYRCGVLTDYLNMHNSGDVLYPSGSSSMAIRGELDEVKLNLKNLKKVKKLDGNGDDVETFVKTGPDHYGHAISYLNIACQALGEHLQVASGMAAPASVSSFKTQGQTVGKIVSGVGANSGGGWIRN